LFREKPLKQSIKTIIACILESSEKEMRNQLSYLLPTLSEDDKFDLFEEISKILIDLTESDKLDILSINSVKDINEVYADAIETQTKMSKLINKVEIACSIIQPISDHSLRGTMFYLDKEVESQQSPQH
jgi:hypothetical protein